MAWRDELCKIAAESEIRLDEPLREHTSFRIGGPVDALVIPGSRTELRRVLDFAVARGVPWLILGRGTNLLVRDGGLRGLAIKTMPCLRQVHVSGVEIKAGAGISLAELAGEAASRSLAGMAFAAGIPGTLGGGTCMNAGAYGGELSQVLTSVTAYYPGGGERILIGKDLGLGYRTSRFQADAAVIEEVDLALTPGDEAAIREEMSSYARRRQEKQPLSLPSAGSVFKRPPGGFAGTLIQEAGLKGTRIGGAQISNLHANFIVNMGGAKAADVLALVALVQRVVREKAGIQLEPEIRIVGED